MNDHHGMRVVLGLVAALAVYIVIRVVLEAAGVGGAIDPFAELRVIIASLAAAGIYRAAMDADLT